MPVSQMAKTLTQDINKRNQLQASFVELSNHCKMTPSPSAPIISIVVPIYNRARFLSGCLDSILAQTFKEWECILVNDGSTDNRLEIAENYAANDPRFLVISQENQGVSAARNLGIDHAQGKWLAFVDSDDEIDPDYLETLHKIGEDNNVDLINGKTILFAKNGQTYSHDHDNIVYSAEEEKLGRLFYERMSGIVKLYRMSIIREHDLRFDTTFNFAEDLIFTLEFYLQAQRFATSSTAIYKYNCKSANDVQLSLKTADFQTELALYQKLISLYEQIGNRNPHLMPLLHSALHIYDITVSRLLSVIEKQTNSIAQRYKMYRFIKLPSFAPVKESMFQTLRYYLLYKQQYFLFALSRIWVNRY